MDGMKNLQQIKSRLEEVYDPDKARVEQLRQLLQSEQGRPVSYQEAYEIGRELVSFYQSLAGSLKITRDGLDNLLHNGGKS